MAKGRPWRDSGVCSICSSFRLGFLRSALCRARGISKRDWVAPQAAANGLGWEGMDKIDQCRSRRHQSPRIRKPHNGNYPPKPTSPQKLESPLLKAARLLLLCPRGPRGPSALSGCTAAPSFQKSEVHCPKATAARKLPLRGPIHLPKYVSKFISKDLRHIRRSVALQVCGSQAAHPRTLEPQLLRPTLGDMALAEGVQLVHFHASLGPAPVQGFRAKGLGLD